jgi:ABC-type lipoprotein export system ATPase subunit
MPNLNLVENVMLPQDFLRTFHPVVSKERALDLLDMVGILEHAYKIPAHISGGQKQRVAIARALINDPVLIIADEPTGNLDSITAEKIFQMFENLVEMGKTVVMVTHDDNIRNRFSRHIQIKDGTLIYENGNLPTQLSTQRENCGKTTIHEVIVDKETDLDSDKSGISMSGNRFSSKKKKPASEDRPPVIELKNIDKNYANAAGKFTALKGINLKFNQGEFTSIIGKSGCGKSTLLNMITGIDRPTSGRVLVNNEDVYKMSESQRSLWRGRNIGVVFQFFQLLPMLTLLENTMLPMDYCNVYEFKERPDHAMDILKMVGLEEHAHKSPSTLSSGQQQSAAIARALATNPPILLADEPTGNLDSRSANKILSLLGSLADEGKTILIVTHDPTITDRTDRTVILSDGEVIDPMVVDALPFLDHPLMLSVTHNVVKRVYQPGSMIIQQGEPAENLYMIADGEVEIIVNSKIPETRVATLGPGQFFGEVSLTRGGQSIASVRTISNKPAELGLIPKKQFLELLIASPRMSETVNKIAESRIRETQQLIESYQK